MLHKIFPVINVVKRTESNCLYPFQVKYITEPFSPRNCNKACTPSRLRVQKLHSFLYKNQFDQSRLHLQTLFAVSMAVGFTNSITLRPLINVDKQCNSIAQTESQNKTHPRIVELATSRTKWLVSSHSVTVHSNGGRSSHHGWT